MPKILELDPHVADLIAAGEVVERPASVVKELIENSIDAGAGIITVEITSGGMTYIRVTDNGCGISPEDVQTAFLRHATSKLRGADGLEAIGTLGFRGEALAAIAAVSRIEMLTRQPGEPEGVGLALEAGIITDLSPAGCPEGTTIIVRDLFFNTPARLKFVKSDRAESSGVASAVLRSALSRPEVSVRFVRDGKTEYHTPGDSRIDSCIYSLLGREFSTGLLKAETVDESVAVTGYVSPPSAARGNRSYQFFFINGRPIRSIMLQAALERAFTNNIPVGRFPSCALYITIKPCDVDVNVHPAKTEVKFVSDKQVFDSVYYAALGALERYGAQRGAEHVEQGALNGIRGSEGEGDGKGGSCQNFEFGILNSGIIGKHAFKAQRGGFKSMDAGEFKKKYAQDAINSYNLTVNEAYPSNLQLQKPVNAEFEKTGDSEFDNIHFRIIGEALNTYIIVQYLNSVWFIDKHAAHERIHFNALKSEDFEPMSQTLITPVICRHGSDDISVLLENTELLDRLGFMIESFGEDAVAVRRIPAEIDIADAEQVLSEICVQLKYSGMAEPARHDNIFRAVACKAAIKAGRLSDMRELEALAARVMSGEISQCPHGRPVAFEMTKASLDKSFKRT